MKRKMITLLLALAMVLGLAVSVSATEDRITSGDWVYELHSGKATLVTYVGMDTEVIVPAQIDGYDVDTLGWGVGSAFSAVSETMTSVTLEEGIATINNAVFKNCTALKQAYVPGTVTSIGMSAFEGCTSLTDVTLNEGLKQIGHYAFLNTGLTSVFLPASVNLIYDDALGYTGEWGDTDKVDGFAIFGWSGSGAQEYARDWHFTFYRLDDMEEYSGRCGDNATWRFEEATGTLYIEGEDDTDPYYNNIQPWVGFSEDIKRVVIGDGIFHLGDGSFAEFYPNLTEVILPDSLHGLGNDAFLNCSALTSVNIPSELTYIYTNAFRGTGLTEVTLPPYGEYDYMIAARAFADCADLTKVVFTGEAPDFGKEVFLNDTLTAWYPAGEPSWTADVMQSYGGNVTWAAYNPELFTDVPVDSFYYEPVAWAVENGVTNGISATEFGPTLGCNRAQIVTFLWRAAGSPEPETAVHSFVDVEKGSFYEKAVLWAVETGITTGTDATHFSPLKTCTRAEVVTFLWRAEGKPAVNAANPFVDVTEEDFFFQAVLWAVENGITNGMDATHFGPLSICNRAQVVTFLYRTAMMPKPEPAKTYTFELRTNDPSEEIGYVFCEGSSFAAGERVQFYAEPWYGYVVEFEAEPADETLELYYLGARTYELVMPDHDVVLTANFVPAQGDAHYITTTCTNGFAFADCDMDDDLNDFAKPGELVLFYILPDEGFTFSPEDFTATVGGEKWENCWYLGELVEEDPELGIIDGIFLYEMVMPDADVSVTITCTAEASAAAEADVRIPVTLR